MHTLGSNITVKQKKKRLIKTKFVQLDLVVENS